MTMSMAALLQGVETRLRSSAVLNDSSGNFSGVQPTGKPPANAGQWYYAIHVLDGSEDDQSPLSDDRLYSVGITITRKISFAPADRRGVIITASNELLQVADAVSVAVHGDYTTMANANSNISGAGNTTNGFIEPLCYLGGAEGPIQEKAADWLSAKSGLKGDHVGALVLALRFGKARRLRKF